MNARIFSRVVFKVTTLAIVPIATSLLCSNASGQGSSGYYTDPDTGIIYRKVIRTVERPVVETKVEQRQQTIYRPQTVTETTPQPRTVFSPVVEYCWEPRLHGRWNPFQKPTWAYHHVARTHWERRDEMVEQTNTRTEWVAENRTIEVPKQVVRMEREETTDYQVVGRVPNRQANPSGVSTAIASRLRPIDPGALGSTRIASSDNGISGRNTSQGGMRPIDLHPGTTRLLPGPVSSNGGIVAGKPLPPTIFR